MADEHVVYTLTTPAGSILFNNGDLDTTTDLYWIQSIEGLDGGTIRAPIDNRPQTDGGIVHNFFLEPRRFTIEGLIIIQSVAQNQCMGPRNTMEEALRAALESILAADGTLAWTPTGQAARSLTVRNHIRVDYAPVANYRMKSFVFGLVAANPDW